MRQVSSCAAFCTYLAHHELESVIIIIIIMQPLSTSMLHDVVLLHMYAGFEARADMVLPEEFEDDYLLMESLDLPASTLPR